MRGSSATLVSIGAQIADLSQFAFVGLAGTTPVLNGIFVDQYGNEQGLPFSQALVADTVYTWLSFWNLAYGVSLSALPDPVSGVIFDLSLPLSYCIGNTSVTKAQLQGKGPTWAAALNRSLGQVA